MASRKLCFLVGSVALSGGTYVIFQHASYLCDQGYDVTLAVQEPFDMHTFAWHDQAHRLRIIPFMQAQNEAFDLVIATWWKTALELPAFRSTHYAYFVQSIETRFYPEEEKALRRLVDETYRLPVSCVTEASWIAAHLKDRFGQNAALVRNGIRKDIYTVKGKSLAPRYEGEPRILVEGHFGVPFKNTALALRLARKAGARDIWVMTGSPVSWLPGVNRVCSRIPIHKTSEIYRSCDILLKLSTVEGMFGPPLEMFHCGGTALVFDVSGHEEYMRADDNSIVIKDRDVKQVVSQLRMLLCDREQLTRLQHKAMETASTWPDWGQSSESFRQWIDRVLQAPCVDRNAVTDIVQAAWARYTLDERQNLSANPWITWKHGMKKLVRRLPIGFQNKIKQAQVLFEVLRPSRKVY